MQKITSKNTLISVFLAFMLCALSASAKQTANQLRSELNQKPEATLQQLIALNNSARKKNKSVDIRHLEQQSPIWALSECTNANASQACRLSRLSRPEYRTAFEQKMVNALLKKSKAINNRPLEMVDFCAGRMFQLLVTLNKFLVKNPTAQINIHAIDMRYAPYAAHQDGAGNSRIVDSATPLNVGPMASGNEYQALLTQAAAQQLVAYLRSAFPNAKITLSLHGSAQSYWEYREKHALICPDVMSGADLDKGASDYDLLCKKLLGLNPAMHNIQLAKMSNSSVALRERTIETGAGKHTYRVHEETVYGPWWKFGF